MTAKRMRQMGNGLMIAGGLGVIITFFPLLYEEFLFRLGKTQDITQLTSGYTIHIPGLKLVASIIPQVDPFDPGAYRAALKQGIAQAQGTALPDEEGTQYLFAHSSDNPWNLARANTAFYRLPRITLEDEIWITYKGDSYRYTVVETKVVTPDEIQYLETATSGVDLILQTCWPIGTDYKRFLVLARRGEL